MDDVWLFTHLWPLNFVARHVIVVCPCFSYAQACIVWIHIFFFQQWSCILVAHWYWMLDAMLNQLLWFTISILYQPCQPTSRIINFLLSHFFKDSYEIMVINRVITGNVMSTSGAACCFNSLFIIPTTYSWLLSDLWAVFIGPLLSAVGSASSLLTFGFLCMVLISCLLILSHVSCHFIQFFCCCCQLLPSVYTFFHNYFIIFCLIFSVGPWLCVILVHSSPCFGCGNYSLNLKHLCSLFSFLLLHHKCCCSF